MMWASQDYAAEAAADIEDQGIEEDLETDAEGSALPGATSKAEEGMPAQIDIATHGQGFKLFNPTLNPNLLTTIQPKP